MDIYILLSESMTITSEGNNQWSTRVFNYQLQWLYFPESTGSENTYRQFENTSIFLWKLVKWIPPT